MATLPAPKSMLWSGFSPSDQASHDPPARPTAQPTSSDVLENQFR